MKPSLLYFYTDTTLWRQLTLSCCILFHFVSTRYCLGPHLSFLRARFFFNNCCLWHLLLVCSVVLFNTFDSSMDGVWYATLTLSSLSLVYYFWWWVSLCESWLDQISWHESHLWAVCVFTSVQMTEELPEFQSDSSLSDLHLFTAAVTCISGLTHTFRHREQIWHDPPPH